MQPFHPALGVLLHLIGGLAAASFYLPYRQVRGWSWERAWLTGGIWSWVVAPWMFALLLVPAVTTVIGQTSLRVLFWSWFFGALWGVGAVTYGLTMRFLGLALGNAVALGLCAFFGTLIPPLYAGRMGAMFLDPAGRTVLLGLALALVGIVFSGRAGVLKERELTASSAGSDSRGEFNLWKGIVVAIISGLMSACMAFGFSAGEPIAEAAVRHGTAALWQNIAVLVVVLLGGLSTNLVYCIIKIARSKAGPEVPPPTGRNMLLCAVAGVTWYLQYFFYGMGTTQLGRLNAASWPLHMASIILFATLWGMMLREWKGTSRATHAWIGAGLAVLVLSIIVIGAGNR